MGEISISTAYIIAVPNSSEKLKVITPRDVIMCLIVNKTNLLPRLNTKHQIVQMYYLCAHSAFKSNHSVIVNKYMGPLYFNRLRDTPSVWDVCSDVSIIWNRTLPQQQSGLRYPCLKPSHYIPHQSSNLTLIISYTSWHRFHYCLSWGQLW